MNRCDAGLMSRCPETATALCECCGSWLCAKHMKHDKPRTTITGRTIGVPGMTLLQEPLGPESYEVTGTDGRRHKFESIFDVEGDEK